MAASITHADLLGNHPSVQDLNIITSPNTNNPVKQRNMQTFRNMNAQFIGDDFSSPSNSKKQGGLLLCAPTGGPRIIAVRNEENIRKGVAKRALSVSGGGGGVGSSSAMPTMMNSSARPLANEEAAVDTKKKLGTTTAAPQVFGPNGLTVCSSSTASQHLPPKSPQSNHAATAGSQQQQQPFDRTSTLVPPILPSNNNNNKGNISNDNNKYSKMSLPQLLRYATQRRKPGAATTPSEISLVTSVESRDASTNHPFSETVYSCACCRPRKPGMFGAPPLASSTRCQKKLKDRTFKTHSGGVGGSSVVASSFLNDNDDDDEDDDDSLYDNLTSVSQRGQSSNPLIPTTHNQQQFKLPVKKEQQITARQIFELQQAKAAASGSYGHNESKKSGGGGGAGGGSARNAMGFGLMSQRVLDRATNRGLSARSVVSEISSLTHTTSVGVAGGEGCESGSKVGGNSEVGSRISQRSVSSTAVRKLEAALEQERADRLKTEEQISKIRERQERLMAQLSHEERRRMQELLGAD